MAFRKLFKKRVFKYIKIYRFALGKQNKTLWIILNANNCSYKENSEDRSIMRPPCKRAQKDGGWLIDRKKKDRFAQKHQTDSTKYFYLVEYNFLEHYREAFPLSCFCFIHALFGEGVIYIYLVYLYFIFYIYMYAYIFIFYSCLSRSGFILTLLITQ